jgi:hypothetical protein
MQFDFLEVSFEKITGAFTPLLISSFAQLAASINPVIGTLSLISSLVYSFLKIKKDFFPKNNNKNNLKK